MKRRADDNTDLFRDLAVPARAEQAWGEIYGLYWATLTRYIACKFNTLNQQDAEDITHDVFLKLWAKRLQVAPMDAPKYWLFKVAQNDALDFLKTARRKKLQPLDDYHLEIPDDSQAEDRRAEDERWELVREAIARLPPEAGKALRMRYEQGIGNQKIAEKLGKSAQTVGNQLWRGIRKLQEWLHVGKPAQPHTKGSKKEEQ